jgi:4-aminobutyrate aminotransferase/4-aminobutyrate aminotransferase/(S)-3-amino-2-methylpropionate transaminase
MVGIELMDGDRPDGALAARVQEAALQRGVLVLTCGPDANVLRLLPPLTIPEDELEEGLDRIEAAIVEAAA